MTPGGRNREAIKSATPDHATARVQFWAPPIMRASVRIFSGLAIGIVVCFAGAIVVAITLALAQMYFSRHGINAPFLTREYSHGSIHLSGADIIFLAASVGLGILAMGIWFFATRLSKADKAAFSGAGIITGADSTPATRNPRKPTEPSPPQ